MTFRENYRLENRAGSTALIFKKVYLIWLQMFRPMSGLLCLAKQYLNYNMFDSKEITFFFNIHSYM